MFVIIRGEVRNRMKRSFVRGTNLLLFNTCSSCCFLSGSYLCNSQYNVASYGTQIRPSYRYNKIIEIKKVRKKEKRNRIRENKI